MTTQRRPGAWLPSVYYYLAAIVGLVILLVGLIGGLRGLVTAAVPGISNEVRYPAYAPAFDKTGNPITPTPDEEARARADAEERARIGGLADALYGAVAVVVATPVFLWHLRQARRREPELLGLTRTTGEPATPPDGPAGDVS
jgi:hypothetical protein